MARSLHYFKQGMGESPPINLLHSKNVRPMYPLYSLDRKKKEVKKMHQKRTASTGFCDFHKHSSQRAPFTEGDATDLPESDRSQEK